MRFKLHFALGCLGWTLGSVYRDLRIDRLDWSLHLFVCRGKATGTHECHSKSWYVLRRGGWYLLRREDRWGEYRGKTQNGEARRRAPLYEYPDEGISQRAWQLRTFFKPYQLIDWYGRQVEVISYPSPEKMSVNLMIREPGDPTTLEEVVLQNFIPPTGPV